MTTRRVRLTRLTREEIEITVHYMTDTTSDTVEKLFRAAEATGQPIKLFEEFDTLSQYGYVHPDGVPADATINSDGILVVSPETGKIFRY